MAGDPYSKSTQLARPERPAKRKGLRRSHGNTVPAVTVTALAKRAGFRCEARTEDCWGSPEHPHHRATKGRNGPDHSLANLLAVCRSCHDELHRRRAWARRHGLIVGRGDSLEVLVPDCPFDCDIDHRTEGVAP